MRLICGHIRLDDTAASERLLQQMLAQLVLPALQPRVAMRVKGAAALAVVDFSSHGGQPEALPEHEGEMLAADVRLDDPAGLARTVGLPSAAPHDALLLSLLHTLGPSGLDRVLGDFAFALWNEEMRVLTCGRDPFGIRPLAYAHRPGEIFAFASFPKALHGAGIVARRLDEFALARQINRELRSDDSPVAGISRLPPGHYLEVSRERLSLKRYLQFDRASIGSFRGSPEDAAREMRRLVEQAVACRLPRQGEIGAHLSGGLDSSAVAVIAARMLRGQGRCLHAYSFFDRQRNDFKLEDESEFVKSIVDQEKDLDWTPIPSPKRLSVHDGQIDADKIVGLGADLRENVVGAHAKAQDVGLVLSGWGGDEAASFNGRGVLFDLFLRGRWRRLARELSALKRERGWPKLRVFRGQVLWPMLPRELLQWTLRRRGSRRPLELLFHATLSASMRDHFNKSFAGPLSFAPTASRARWTAVTSPHIGERAEIWALIGSRHGLAYAFPLLDHRLVAFALSLPNDFFLRDGFGRRTFRDAMRDLLPERIRNRHTKLQVAPSLAVDLAGSGPDLLDRIDALKNKDAVRRVVDLDRLRSEIAQFPPAGDVYESLRRGETHPGQARMLAVSHALLVATYIDQHGAE